MLPTPAKFLVKVGVSVFWNFPIGCILLEISPVLLTFNSVTNPYLFNNSFCNHSANLVGSLAKSDANPWGNILLLYLSILANCSKFTFLNSSKSASVSLKSWFHPPVTFEVALSSEYT